MIISHKYKFIFIKTMKTAGTSIEVFLSRHCGDDDIFTPIWPHLEPHCARNHQGLWNPLRELLGAKDIYRCAELFKDLRTKRKYYNHIPAAIVEKRTTRNIWDNYFKFCVERNPWDKTLSHYYMMSKRTEGGMSFDDYLSRGQFCLNYPRYTDENGVLLVDKVIKYESLVDELAALFGMLNIPFNGTLGVRAKSDYRKDRRPYTEIYSSKQRQTVERAFAKEIEMHNYKF